MTDEAEQSIPSRGSHGEPVGWQATDEFGRPSGFLSWKDGETRWPKSATVPLYIRPQPTLTDEERAAIEWYAGYGKGDHAKTLRGLLERLG